jgi:hypothetical protein
VARVTLRARIERGTIMTTADAVRDRALSLARSGIEREDALRDLQDCCGDRRVSVVRARQQLATAMDSETEQPDQVRAIELLDELLGRLPA